MNITEHLAINKNPNTDDIEVLVMIEGSEFVHKADIKVSDWPDYLWFGYNGKKNAENIQGRYRSTLEYVRLQDWSWTATDGKKKDGAYGTPY